ncbi:AAA family ATPase [Ornithinibacillus scapharcae]|uniref:AAA family ATPase n=1 Tax=Ornithinibacillus scapharcae TaxID=1147159 RepID=UPI000225BA48|nr:AAA family ATPase [Ornithinibacillus scapharcae]
MREVGMYGGKFVPIHMGHVHAMIQASTMVKELHFIVSYDEAYEREVFFKGAQILPIPYKVRLRWWKQLTKEMSHVHVHAIQEKQTGHFSDWEYGAKAIKDVIGKEIDTVFSSEVAYEDYFHKLYPNAEHILLDKDRLAFPISATKIRTEGVMKHWDFLPNIVKPYFVKKVAIVGTGSTGKSTLVKNLASLYNTTCVQEVGRSFYDRLGTYETMKSDFAEIAFEHHLEIKKQLNLARKILFVDTEALVTQNFSIAYERIRQPILDGVAKLQQFGPMAIPRT